jgi:hypothetical protein
MSEKIESYWRKVEILVEREAGKAGLRGKVNAKCIDCIYDPKGVGNWRQQVSQCTVESCPLYNVRPRSKPHKRKPEQ